MAHTSWLKTLRRTFYRAHQANMRARGDSGHPTLSGRAHWSRRRFIKLAALAGGTAIATHHLADATPAWGNGSPKIAIIGGGIAGLNAAYHLQKAGLEATVYEARNRVGGRMQSVTGAVGSGLVSDLGGHLVNTNHTDMIALAEEFGINLFDRVADVEALPFPDIAYFFNNSLQSEAEIADKLRPLADQILADAIALDENFDTTARRLDRLSVTQYLDRHRSKILDPFIRVLIEQTIRTEYGVEPQDSSALQLIFNLPLVEGDQVELLGASDEVFSVEGGSAQITNQLATVLGDQIHLRMPLTAIQRRGQRYRLSLGDTQVDADYVILTLPFPVLRRIDLQVNLPRKLERFIQEGNLGANEKFLLGFNERIWRQEAGFSLDLWTDFNFASAWEGSQRQVDQSAAELTLYFGGDSAKALLQGDQPRNQRRRLLRDFNTIIPGAETAANGGFFRTAWATDPFTRGAYSSFKPGQLTDFANFFYIEADNPAERQDVRVGNLLFAGEHLSDEFYGFMNGAAQTGRLAAESILRDVI